MSLQTQINAGGLPSVVPTVHSPVAAVTIPVTTEQVQLTNAGAVTMTAVPTLTTAGIASGARATVFQTGAGTTVLQDDGTLPGSGLQLQSTTRTLAQFQTMVLVYDGTYWCEESYSGSGSGGGSGVIPFNAGIDDPFSTLLLQMTGPNLGTSFPDTGYNTFTIVNGGVPITSTAQSQFGTSSGLFTGAAGSYLDLPIGTNAIAMNAADFTVEAWIYMTANTPYAGLPSVSTAIIDTRNGGGGSGIIAAIASGTNFLTLFLNGGVSSSASAVPLNTWTHCCWMRLSGVLYFFVNGVVDASTPAAGGSATGDTVTVGMSIERNPGFPKYQGYMNDFRYSNGLARYAIGGFTPSATPLPPGTNTALLPAAPVAGQMALSSNNIYGCTNAVGPIWKRTPISSI